MTALPRRRFLQIAAAALASPTVAYAKPAEWRGFAFGAEVSIKLFGDELDSKQALEEAVSRMKELEKIFSIYDPQSELSKLNAGGSLNAPSVDFVKLAQHVDLVHHETDGLFDPTVQRIFEARAQKIPYTVLTAARSTSWHRVSHDANRISFPDPQMGLTFNGIAQGYITDEVRKLLEAKGYTKTLVNIGEYAAGDRLSKIGIADHKGKLFEVAEIKNQAIATSSPDGFRFRDGSSHIILPDGRDIEPLWRTVSVIAESATMADGFSTALALAPDAQLARQLKQKALLKEVYLQSKDGEVTII